VTPRLDPLGDAALVATFATAWSEEANDRVLALAASLRDAPLADLEGVRDIVPAIASLAVHFAPGTDIERAAGSILARWRAIEPIVGMREARPRPVHDIRVRYGGDAGPDLDDVAAFAGLTPRDVVSRHASRLYRVYMIGFLPGFAYLGDVDASIAAPRRPSPRQQVPSGSVGIAGRQTGVYPRESPGGWQIIGRTSLPMFDEQAGSLLQPGDRVRFVPEDPA
jgi:KipI family sensor histidine kinase inhibitor